MARGFTIASNMALTAASAVVSAAPYSIACWFRPTNTANTNRIFCLSNTAGSRYVLLAARGDVAGDPLSFQRNGTGSDDILNTSASFSLNTWQHALAVAASATDVRLYLDGANKVTSSANHAPSVTRTAIGAFWDGTTASQGFGGDIAEFAIWSVALDDDDAALLAKGVSPLLIRPTALIAYWPLIGRHSPEIDIRGGFGLTLTNTPVVADHPRIIYAAPPHAAPPTGAASLVTGYYFRQTLLGVGM